MSSTCRVRASGFINDSTGGFMMNSKKVIATILSILIVTSLCGCGEDGSGSDLGQSITDLGQNLGLENKPEISQNDLLDALDDYGAERLSDSEITDYDATTSAADADGYYIIADQDDEWQGRDDYTYSSLLEGKLPFASEGESPLMSFNPTELVRYYDYDSDLERIYDEDRSFVGYDEDDYTGYYNINIWYITFDSEEDARNCYDFILNTELENYVIGSKYYTDYELSENARAGIRENSEWYYVLDFNGNFPNTTGMNDYLNGDVHFVSACYLNDLGLMFVNVDIYGDYYEDTQDDLEDIFGVLDADNPLSDPALISVPIRPRTDMMSLTTVVIPEGTEYIADSSFSNEDVDFERRHTISSISLPSSLVSIGNNAFSSCGDLTAIEIPDGVVSIGAGAFSKCHSLTTIVIPESVTTIGDEAFYYCDGLTSISIPDGVEIGNDAFARCSSLASINDMNPTDWANSQGLDLVAIGLS